ncbi:MAG: hypothetical protein H6923_00135 [Alphaproteobacteria bacterium]|nr:hypothetical protein [Alphaproteobacteria bacterium]
MSQKAVERRSEHRFVVEDIDLSVNGEDVTIVDISVSAVRISRPRAGDATSFRLVFRVTDDEAATYETSGRLIRETAECVVIGYAPPCEGWGAILNAHDSLLRTRLGSISFA